MGSCGSRPRGFPEREKPMVDDMPVTPKAVAAPVESDAPVVEDKYEIVVVEAPLVDLSTPKGVDACKVTEELIPVISELLVPMTEEADKDTEVVVVEEVTVAAEKQN
ncbi:hypothetical protein ZWY2020_045990 [Hordeum vulgare]|nr:hypothetical protein ZWY2020_045990 [Hordeum vulgare]